VPPVKAPLIAVAGVVVTLLAAVAAVVTVIVWPARAPHSHVPAALQAALDRRVDVVLTGYDEFDACAITGATTCAYRCTAHTFDLDPRGATTLDRVTAAYVVADCGEHDSAGIDSASRDVYAIRFGSPPAVAEGPDDATPTTLARIFPAHAVGAAWWYYTDGTFTLRDRLHRLY
jgi:hypothetical protein